MISTRSHSIGALMPFLLLFDPGVRAQGTGITTNTSSTSGTRTIHSTAATGADVETYLTRVTARFGTGPLLYDQSFNAQLSDPAVQAGIQSARGQLPGATSITGPTLLSSARTLFGSNQNTVVNNTQVIQTAQVELFIGPQSILIGYLGLCTGPAPVPGQTIRPTGCPGGTVLVILSGNSNINVNTNSQSDIFQTTTTTNTYRTSQTYELNGTAAPSPPATPAPPSLWLAICGIAATGIYYMKRNRNPDGA